MFNGYTVFSFSRGKRSRDLMANNVNILRTTEVYTSKGFRWLKTTTSSYLAHGSVGQQLRLGSVRQFC